MSIQYKFFIIPVRDIEESEEEINQFLRTARVVEVQREFIERGLNSFWSVSVEYTTAELRKGDKSASKRKPTIDYKEVLSPEDFSVFAKLREWRKGASKKEGIELYNVLTNEHLAIISEKRVRTKKELQEIEGIGDMRVKKYSDDIIGIVKQETEAQEKKAVSSESGEIFKNK